MLNVLRATVAQNLQPMQLISSTQIILSASGSESSSSGHSPSASSRASSSDDGMAPTKPSLAYPDRRGGSCSRARSERPRHGTGGSGRPPRLEIARARSRLPRTRLARLCAPRLELRLDCRRVRRLPRHPAQLGRPPLAALSLRDGGRRAAWWLRVQRNKRGAHTPPRLSRPPPRGEGRQRSWTRGPSSNPLPAGSTGRQEREAQIARGAARGQHKRRGEAPYMCRALHTRTRRERATRERHHRAPMSSGEIYVLVHAQPRARNSRDHAHKSYSYTPTHTTRRRCHQARFQ